MKRLTPLTQSHAFSTVPSVQNELTSIARFLDQTILKLERELARARKARAALDESESEPIWISAEGNSLHSPHGSSNQRKAGPRKTGSLGDHLMTVLRKEGPLTVKTIHERVSARGKIVGYHTLSSMVNYYYRRGYILRTGKGTYAVAPTAPADDAPTPTLTNGAPIPKALR